MILLEFVLTASIIPLAYLAPNIGKEWAESIARGVFRIAARRPLAVLVIFVVSLGTRLAVLSIEPVPAPGIQDEFGYLLSGDTFAHGRLTNPTHPLWVNFESMTIIQRPTYCSAFYPAQGVFLAVGQVVFRHPFWGVWLSTGLMCATICWALQAWMPSGWAFLGGILAIVRLGTFTYWANSYWGGAVAAIGGALVIGALPRIQRKRRIRDALLIGVGFALLANSRPYEGLFYSLPILFSLALFFFSDGVRGTSAFLRTAVPLVTFMALTFGFMAYYFWATTGNPLQPPYLVNVNTYMQEPQFIWQSMRPAPQYHNQVMAQFYGGYHLRTFLDAKHAPFITALGKLFYFWIFFLGPALTLPFFVLAGVLPFGMSLRDLGTKSRFFLLIIIVSTAAILLPVYFKPHYAAPAVCVTYALVLQAMRRVKIWDRSGKRKGVAVVRTTVAAILILFVTTAVALATGIPESRLFPYDLYGQNIVRAKIAEGLTRQGGKHLIIVRYGPGHDGHHEWVYNAADIDDSSIVWARDLGTEKNQELLQYFSARRVWIVYPDQDPIQLLPYGSSIDPGR